MAEDTDGDVALLLDRLMAARDARRFVEGPDETSFMSSRLHQNAVVRSLEVIGEAAVKVSPVTLAAHPEIPWREMTGTRHRLIHGYAEVRLELVWIVVQERLAELIKALEPLIPKENDIGQ